MEPLKIAPMIVDRFRDGVAEVRLDVVAGLQFHRKADPTPPEIIIKKRYFDTYLKDVPKGDAGFAECLNNIAKIMHVMFTKTHGGYLTLVVDASGDGNEEVDIARSNIERIAIDNTLTELGERVRNNMNNPEKFLEKIEQMKNEA